MATEEFLLRIGVRDAEAREDVRSFVNLLQGMGSQVSNVNESMAQYEQMVLRTGASFENLTGMTRASMERTREWARTVEEAGSVVNRVFQLGTGLAGAGLQGARRTITGGDSLQAFGRGLFNALGTIVGDPGPHMRNDQLMDLGAAQQSVLGQSRIRSLLPFLSPLLGPAANLGPLMPEADPGELIATADTRRALARRNAMAMAAESIDRRAERQLAEVNQRTRRFGLSDLALSTERRQEDLDRQRLLRSQLQQIDDQAFLDTQRFQLREFDRRQEALSQFRTGGTGGRVFRTEQEVEDFQRQEFIQAQRFQRTLRARGQLFEGRAQGLVDDAADEQLRRENVRAIEDLTTALDRTRQAIEDDRRAAREEAAIRVVGDI